MSHMLKAYTYEEGFCIIETINNFKLFYFPDQPSFFMYRDFIDVTHNPIYRIKNIMNGSLHFTNIFFEGTDGVGKTTLSKNLAKVGIITEDRCVKYVSKVMDFSSPKDKRLDSIREFLSDGNKKLVFIFFLDENKLRERINSREEISEYDKVAIEKQHLYLESYQILKDEFENISAIDATNLSENQMVELVKNEFIDNNNKER